MNVIVLAGGWSCSKYNVHALRDYGQVIGVNDAAIYATCDEALTMDRLWLEHRYETMLSRTMPVHYRKCTAKNVKPYELWFKPFTGNVHQGGKMSEDPTEFWGSNSGACAVNLAYHLRPKQVFLFGFDGLPGPDNERHWYPDYPWGGGTKPGKLLNWASEYEVTAKQFAAAKIPVWNVNFRSTLRAFKQITFEAFLKEARRE